MIASSPAYDTPVRASLYYAAPSDGQLFHYAYAPHGTRETNIEFVEHVVDIHDVRQSRAPRLDVEGASFLSHRSAVRSFYDADELHRIGYPETADLVRRFTGAAEVVVFDHNIRRGGRQEEAAASASDIKRPVFHIHTDFSDRSAPVRAAAVLGKAAACGRRLAAINVWRPLAEPLRDCPLALCDASSIEMRDLRETDLLYPDRTGQIYYMTFNPAHRWYYASDMRTDEVWMFKNYDAATDGRARFTPHTAFVDTTRKPAAARESIEFRTFAFFDEPALST